jgi:phospholipase C
MSRAGHLTTMLAAAALAAGPATAQVPPAAPAAPVPPRPLVTPQPAPDATIQPYVTTYAPGPARDQLITELRSKVKYVFVIFNENHSFDNEFGTFPGANGLYSDGLVPRDAAHTPGFEQFYTDANGEKVSLHPFRIGPEQNATVVDSVDHSHAGLAKKLDVKNSNAAMDGFAAEEYERYASKGGPANVGMGTQYARLVMSYIDCDTIPYSWQYADRFVLFDNIFATEDTPSTPNAIAMIAGQAGETQWVKHGPNGEHFIVGNHAGTTHGPPLVNDPQPFYGSQFDTTLAGRQPDSPTDYYGDTNIATNLTFASLPLTFAGGAVGDIMKQDRAPARDLPDIQKDIPFLAARNAAAVNWRWYQEGYDHEPTDPAGVATHASYVSHHQGPQYFGYVANNPGMDGHLRGMGDLFDDLASGNFPVGGGVFYVRGGFTNVAGLKPPIQNANYPAPLTQDDKDAIAKAKSGDDDHPAYTDRQISEAMAARVINAIASRPDIWNQAAIVITYDESDGFYDHVPPRILSYGPDGLPLARGIRIPMIVISPYARAHAVSHAEGDHNSVIETIEAIFDLPALANLPDEAQALHDGEDPRFAGPNGFVQHYLGPRDLNSPQTDDLLSAFEPRRLSGELPPLPASYALIPDSDIDKLPHFGGKGCTAIGVTPVDRQQGIANEIPARFNALPVTLPQYN